MLYFPTELLNIADIRRYKQRYEAILDYHYEHYTFFQNARAKRLDAIKASLLKHTKTFKFTSWHRVFDLKFIENPLSTRGSILNDPGGRFNIGDINELKFTKFNALYLAENYETAYRERNQIEPAKHLDCGLSSDDLSLSNKGSSVDLLLEGQLESVIDLTDEHILTDFYNEIKTIKLPPLLEKKSKMLNIQTMYHVKSHQELRKSILLNDWRPIPALLDIPANSQIFGHLIHTCLIEGIIYPSKMSSTKQCLAVFPKNFANSNSFIRIQDMDKPPNIKFTELNAETYENLC